MKKKPTKKKPAKTNKVIGEPGVTLLADGFEKAFVGMTVWSSGRHGAIAVYDYDKCVRILMRRDGMNEFEAMEFMDFNVAGGWVGEWTPIFISTRETL
jgi:hypothetical protein